MWVKVCGLREPENIRRVAALGVERVGFIFYRRSVRYAGALDPQVVRGLAEGIRRVGVLVDEGVREIMTLSRRYALDTVQLHGDESPDVCAALRGEGLRVVKALGVETAEDIFRSEDYQDVCDELLFDTKSLQRGGTGRRFDWGLLAGYGGDLPFSLGGGIAPEDAVRLMDLRHPRLAGVDLNSRFESAPGVKDVEAVGNFIKALRGCARPEQ